MGLCCGLPLGQPWQLDLNIFQMIVTDRRKGFPLFCYGTDEKVLCLKRQREDTARIRL